MLPKNPDPERYIEVTTKEGKYYRRKRGLVKPATLNHVLKKNVSLMTICSPVAKRILARLAPDTRHLILGRTQVRLTARLMQLYKRTGQLSISVMNDMDLQPDHPLDRLASCAYYCRQNGPEIKLDIKPFPGSVKKLNSLVTDFYFDAVLLYGHLDEGESLNVETQTSGHYTFGVQESKPCSFHFILPAAATPFVLFLKISAVEGKQMAHHGRHYGMKAVLAG